jgi:hypothetical protein
MTFNINLPIITNVRDVNQVAFQGTAAEMQAKGVKINGVLVDAITLGALAKVGLVKVIGEAAKVDGKRGRPGKILAFVPGVEFNVEV